jgi:hypothetical protein
VLKDRGRGRGALIAWAALAAAVLAPIGWGLAPAFPWDVDNIAPGSVLRVLAQHFAPGWYSSYGPVPYELGALVMAPLLALFKLTGELGTPSAAWPHGFAHPAAALAALTVAVRLLSATMALGLVALAVRRERQQAVAPADWVMPLVALGSATFCYYAHTSNVDLPYLFWLWAAYHLVETPAASRGACALGAACAALAVATKEQSAPLAAVAVLAGMAHASRSAGASSGARLAAAAGPALAALAAYALAWMLPFNLEGWRAHHHFLFAEARYPRTYALDAAGLAALSGRAFTLLPLALGWPAVTFAGLALALRVSWRGLGWRALGCALYLAAFLISIGYVYPRFLLPLALLAFPLAGRGFGAVTGAFRGWSRDPRPLAAGLLVLALSGGPALAWLSLRDPRLDAERWMARHVPPDALVELAGNPQFQARVPVERRLLRTRADSLGFAPRGPRGDIVLLSSLDAYAFQRDADVRATWWDSLTMAPPAGRYDARRFAPGRLGMLARGLPVAPEVWIYVRRDTRLMSSADSRQARPATARTARQPQRGGPVGSDAEIGRDVPARIAHLQVRHAVAAEPHLSPIVPRDVSQTQTHVAVAAHEQ